MSGYEPISDEEWEAKARKALDKHTGARGAPDINDLVALGARMRLSYAPYDLSWEGARQSVETVRAEVVRPILEKSVRARLLLEADVDEVVDRHMQALRAWAVGLVGIGVECGCGYLSPEAAGTSGTWVTRLYVMIALLPLVAIVDRGLMTEAEAQAHLDTFKAIVFDWARVACHRGLQLSGRLERRSDEFLTALRDVVERSRVARAEYDR